MRSVIARKCQETARTIRQILEHGNFPHFSILGLFFMLTPTPLCQDI
jgi:hypothetical protein